MQTTVTSRLEGRLETMAGAAAAPATCWFVGSSWRELTRAGGTRAPAPCALGPSGALRGCPAVAPVVAASRSGGGAISCVLVKSL